MTGPIIIPSSKHQGQVDLSSTNNCLGQVDLWPPKKCLGQVESCEAPKVWRRWPQHLAAVIASLGAMSAGGVLGWSTAVLPYLQESNPSWDGGQPLGRVAAPVTNEQGNWLTSLPYLGAVVGSLFSGDLADCFGRRPFLLGCSIPYLLGWLLIAFTEDCGSPDSKHLVLSSVPHFTSTSRDSNIRSSRVLTPSIPVMLIARFISGLAVGATTTVTPMYIEEIADDHIRGALGVYVDLLLIVGTLCSYIAVAYLSYFWVAVYSASLPLLFLVTFYFMPESPIYLLYKGHKEDAEKALKWLRGSVQGQDDKDIQEDILGLEKLLGEYSVIDTSSILTRILRIPCFLKGVCWSNVRVTSPAGKATFIVTGLMFFQQVCGLDTVITFSVCLLQSSRWRIVYSQYICYVIVTVIQILAVIVSCAVVDRIGRKILLGVSSSSMAVCLAVLSLNSHLNKTSYYSWVLVLVASIYIVAYSVGFGPLPWVLAAEIPPTDEKESIESTANVVSWVLSFIVNQFINNVIGNFGGVVSYGVFGALCVSATVFVAMVVPETKRKPREQIESELGVEN
uniref:Major facilitator superfamily (MFS) profile domain-containing protein n=1 Tax=Timema bartmani TaxID=61472 RepID=A0A7R9I7S9_9NEOP|nr:unnamed protein product [Timema bartmani]